MGILSHFLYDWSSSIESRAETSKRVYNFRISSARDSSTWTYCIT